MFIIQIIISGPLGSLSLFLVSRKKPVLGDVAGAAHLLTEKELKVKPATSCKYFQYLLSKN